MPNAAGRRGGQGSRAQDSYTLHVNCGDGAWGAVPVLVTRKRVKNLNLRIGSDGTVRASVPWRCSRTRAQTFLDEHAAWLRARLERREQATKQREQDERDARKAGTYPLWGREARTADGHVPSASELDGLWRAELARELPGVVAQMEPLIGARATSWQLRAMSSRWGSCTPARGSIRINVRLAGYPRACLEYVVAHELAHLLEPSHNARFHAIVARAIADEPEVRARLRQGPLIPAGNAF